MPAVLKHPFKPRCSVTQWHQEMLDQRWKNYQAGKTKRLTLKQLEQRLAR